MSSEGASPRIGPMRVMSGVWLLLLSGVTAFDHAQLRQVEKTLAARDARTELASIRPQIAALESQMQALTAQPHAVSEAHFETARADWETRLTQLEAHELSAPAATDVQLLQARIGAIEARLAKPARKAVATTLSPSTVPADVTPPVSADPPFTPLGIELRSGEPFLAILPAGSASLSQARALRAGESEGAWMLERLDGREALFRVNGQLQHLIVPR